MYWSSLAAELREMILDALIQKGNVARYACISQEWKAAIEKHNFRSLRLTTSDIPVLETITIGNINLIKYIWYCIEFDEYGCLECDPNEASLTMRAIEANRDIARDSIRLLFCALSARPIQGKFTLDISVYSPSDNQHFFKYIGFEHADDHKSRNISQQTPRKQASTHSSIHDLPPLSRSIPIDRLFNYIILPDSDKFWTSVPQVPSVTHLLLRRQTRGRWWPKTLIQLTAHLPNLQEMCYEPWREWVREGQYLWDVLSEMFFKSLASHDLKKLTIFEDLCETYIAANINGGRVGVQAEPIRIANTEVINALAEASLGLETFSAAFIADAGRFWEARRPQWIWSRLLTISLTSCDLVPGGSWSKINDMLRAAAEAAVAMPELLRMELWNGGPDHASVFRYSIGHSRVGKPAGILWRSSWDLIVEARVVGLWSAVAKSRSAGSFAVIKELLASGIVLRSHGDAVGALGLQNRVACPVSIVQIQREHSAGC